MFDIFLSVKIPIVALLSNKMRSFLTILGIIIGVAAVIVIMSVGTGAQSLILDQIKIFGANLIGVLPGKSEEKGPPVSVMGVVITTLTYEDAMAIKSINNIEAVAAYTRSIGNVSWRSEEYTTNISGVTSEYLDIEIGSVAQGRFITKEEEVNMSRVVVLGSSVVNEIFGNNDPIGKQLKIKNHFFEIIGVMAPKGKVAGQDYDDQVFIPLKTAQKLIMGINHIGFLRAKVNKQENIKMAMEDIATLLRERHGINDKSGESDDFSVRSVSDAIKMIKTITDALKYFLAAMAALSLFVGGIGIMNIMLIAVRERTREIGLRKAVGATNRDISKQFLIETITLTILGGIFGIIGGIIISYLIAIIIRFLDYSWDFVISPLSIILALLVSAIVGLIFGWYPARQASKLDPVEALRYE